MKQIQKYESEVGMIKESGVGQYVKLHDYRTLEQENYQERCKTQSAINMLETERSDTMQIIKQLSELKNELSALRDVYNMNREYIEVVKTRLQNQGFVTELQIKEDTLNRKLND